MSTIKLSAVAIAAMGVFSGAANAATTQYVAMAGASALRTTTLALVQTLCGGTAEGFAAVAAEGGSNIRAYRCGGVNGKVFSLDTDGGSWRAYGTQNLGVIQSQAAAIAVTDPTVKQIRYLDLSLCPAAGGVAPATVTCSAGAAKPVVATNDGATAPKSVAIGFTDVNGAFFDGLTGTNLGERFNRPNGFVGWPKFTNTVCPDTPLGPQASMPLSSLLT